MSISWTTSASRYSIGHWRSAIGTEEMVSYMSYALHIDRNNVSNSVVDACASQVEYLCARGADVKRGLRSSSLHYAAYFGRPQIVRAYCTSISVSVEESLFYSLYEYLLAYCLFFDLVHVA